MAWELFRAMHHHLHVSIDDSFHHHRNGADGETSVPAMVRIANTPNHENKPGDASASFNHVIYLSENIWFPLTVSIQ